jgi:GcrA cell cycle regulator
MTDRQRPRRIGAVEAKEGHPMANPSPTLPSQAATGAAGWTDEKVERLKILWADGYSASQIARELGVTRNAVLGKAHRSGLSNGGVVRAKPAAPTRAARAKPSPTPRGRPPRLEVVRPARIGVAGNGAAFDRGEDRPPREVARVRVEGPGLATPLTIGAHMCRWPIGEPGQEDFTYCGRHAERTFCADHASDAYKPLKAGQPRTVNELARSLRRFL